MTSRYIAAAIAALAIAGCGGDDEEPAQASGGGGQASSEPAKQAATVDIADFKYAPPTVRVKAGGTVTWSNTDSARHNAQTETGANGAFNTMDLDKGDTKKVTFDKPGKFAYYCVYHRFMEANVEVVE